MVLGTPFLSEAYRLSTNKLWVLGVQRDPYHSTTISFVIEDERRVR